MLLILENGVYGNFVIINYFKIMKFLSNQYFFFEYQRFLNKLYFNLIMKKKLSKEKILINISTFSFCKINLKENYIEYLYK